MPIWVDADACPGVIKEILFRAAQRSQIVTTLVANQYIATPASKVISMVQVSAGFDVADNEIVKRVVAGDLVITSDIPLAAEVVEKGAEALSHRGEAYTKETIRQRLSMRDFMENLRSSGVQTGGQAAMNHTDRQTFANKLDRWIAKQQKQPISQPSKQANL
jgi:uncharacterized protein YaiI (UPF0178 family)